PVPTLFYSGTFDDPMKNIPILLQGMARVADTRPDVRLVMSGPGDPTPHLAAAPAAARDRVEIAPLGTPDLSALYGPAWATLAPLYERIYRGEEPAVAPSTDR